MMTRGNQDDGRGYQDDRLAKTLQAGKPNY